MPQSNEYFSILTENPDGPIKIDGTAYTFGSVAVKNTLDCNDELTLLLKISWEQSQKDGKQRLVARHRGLKTDQLKLVRTVLLGPVDEMLQKLSTQT